MRLLDLHPGNMSSVYHTELSSHEGTRCQCNAGRCTIKSAEGWIRPYAGLGLTCASTKDDPAQGLQFDIRSS